MSEVETIKVFDCDDEFVSYLLSADEFAKLTAAELREAIMNYLHGAGIVRLDDGSLELFDCDDKHYSEQGDRIGAL